MTKLHRIGEVENKTGLTRSSIYRLVKSGSFPRPVKLSARASAWREEEIAEWIETRPVSGVKDD